MDLTEDEVIHEAHKMYMRNKAKERRHNDEEYRKLLNKRSWEFQKAKRLKYPEAEKKRLTEYRNRPEVKARMNSKDSINYHQRRQVFFDILGSDCKSCGFKDKRALQIDHINDDGGQQRKKFGGSANEYKYYAKNRDEIHINFQILCANCNWIKRANLEKSKRDAVRCEFPPLSLKCNYSTNIRSD